jgi:3-oxoacyl-[acyl-carrier-protein] synthase I
VEKKMESPLAKQVWVVGDSILSPLGSTSEENFNKVISAVSGLKEISDSSISNAAVYAGQIAGLSHKDGLTRFEQMCVNVITRITSNYPTPPGRTLFILSTTKGNIDLLKEGENHSRIHLHETAKYVAQKTGLENSMVVSNACISGVLAVTIAKRFLQTDRYDHAIVVGADELTNFVVSGFQSLGALSNEACKPFDKDRAGINLGEAAAAILLTSKPEFFSPLPNVKVLGSGLTNDANHISGPSRTGEELALAINQALSESQIDSSMIDFISAHGTATIYNDEMEAKAFNLARLQSTPINSLKGYYGHTLGAAGVVEMIIGLQSLRSNTLVPSKGFASLGVSQSLNITTAAEQGDFKTFLKTASGFGGCNAAIVLQKHT